MKTPRHRHHKSPLWRRLFGLLSKLVSLGILLVLACYWWVEWAAPARLHNDVGTVPRHQTGLLLGTAPYRKEGEPNLYFKHRIEAAVLLYRQQKVKELLLSGDNRTIYYDEPGNMRTRLMAAGVDSAAIVLDPGGLSTAASVQRAVQVFQADTVLIISQAFQLKRALLLAEKAGLTAHGFVAQDVPLTYGIKTLVREHLARVKLVLDLLH